LKLPQNYALTQFSPVNFRWN